MAASAIFFPASSQQLSALPFFIDGKKGKNHDKASRVQCLSLAVFLLKRKFNTSSIITIAEQVCDDSLHLTLQFVVVKYSVEAEMRV
jgi:hypothetical protein